jgi:hypothetical protein
MWITNGFVIKNEIGLKVQLTRFIVMILILPVIAGFKFKNNSTLAFRLSKTHHKPGN